MSVAERTGVNINCPLNTRNVDEMQYRHVRSTSNSVILHAIASLHYKRMDIVKFASLKSNWMVAACLYMD